MFLNLIKYERPDIGICLYVKDPFKSIYQLLINGGKNVGNKKLKKPKIIYWLFTNNSWWLWKFGRL